MIGYGEFLCIPPHLWESLRQSRHLQNALRLLVNLTNYSKLYGEFALAPPVLKSLNHAHHAHVTTCFSINIVWAG